MVRLAEAKMLPVPYCTIQMLICTIGTYWKIAEQECVWNNNPANKTEPKQTDKNLIFEIFSAGKTVQY